MTASRPTPTPCRDRSANRSYTAGRAREARRQTSSFLVPSHRPEGPGPPINGADHSSCYGFPFGRVGPPPLLSPLEESCPPRSAPAVCPDALPPSLPDVPDVVLGAAPLVGGFESKVGDFIAPASNLFPVVMGSSSFCKFVGVGGSGPR